ncbi:hypothetical protein M0813_03768 [Anaeramoeba flamelloides]|uniref:PH domain-containing protein n=1 Tax=Anaeramoeba flamelloides TaxID=1746091 RepID=A0ABQ8XSR9_9EUKA|nr:hypothetical protein M0813_03768 [Anaeramoeba flamelloides]
MSQEVKTVKEGQDLLRLVVHTTNDQQRNGSGLLTNYKRFPLQMEYWHKDWLIAKIPALDTHPRVEEHMYNLPRYIGTLWRPKRRNKWKEFYGVLYDTHLCFYKTKEDYQKKAKKYPKKSILVNQITLVSSKNLHSNYKRDHCFEIKTNKKVFGFSCENKESLERWIEILPNVKKLNGLFNKGKVILQSIFDNNLVESIKSNSYICTQLQDFQTNEGLGIFLFNIATERIQTLSTLCNYQYDLIESGELKRTDINLLAEKLKKITNLEIINYLLDNLKRSDKKLNTEITNHWIRNGIRSENYKLLELLSRKNINVSEDEELCKQITQQIGNSITENKLENICDLIGVIEISRIQNGELENNLFFQCTKEFNLEALQILLQNGCDPDHRTNETLETALHLCSKNLTIPNLKKSINLVQFLISKGADATLLNKSLRTPLDVCVYLFYTTIIPEALNLDNIEVLNEINSYIISIMPSTNILINNLELRTTLHNFEIQDFSFLTDKEKLEQNIPLIETSYNNKNRSENEKNLFDLQWLLTNIVSIESYQTKIQQVFKDNTDFIVRFLVEIIGQCVHILGFDNSQFPSQLYGRLGPLWFCDHRLLNLIVSLSEYCSVVWLCPMTSSLGRNSSFFNEKSHLINFFGEHQSSIISMDLLEINVNQNNAESLLFSGCENGNLFMWDIKSGILINSMAAHEDSIRSICVSNELEYMFTASNDLKIKFWNLNTHQPNGFVVGHKAFINDISVSKSGKYLVSCSDDHLVRIWDTGTKSLRSDLKGHLCAINACSTKFDEIVVSCDERGVIILWKIDQGMLLRKINAHKSAINCLKVYGQNSDDAFAVTGSDDRTIKVHSLQQGTLLTDFTSHKSEIISLDITHDNKACISLDNLGAIYFWGIETGEIIEKICDSGSRATSIKISSIENTFLVSLENGTIRQYNLPIFPTTIDNNNNNNENNNNNNNDNNNNIKDINDIIYDTTKIYRGHKSEITSIDCSLDGSTIASYSIDGKINIWDSYSFRSIITLQTKNRFNNKKKTTLKITPNGENLISSSQGIVQVWSLVSFEMPIQFEENWPKSAYMSSIAVFSDNQAVVSGFSNGEIMLWDLLSGKILKRFEPHDDFISSIQLDPKEQNFISSSHDNTVRLYNWESGEFSSFDANYWTNSAIYTYDLSKVIVATDDGKILVFDLNSKQLLKTLSQNLSSNVNSLVRITDDLMAVISGCTLSIWDTQSYSILTTFSSDETLTSLSLCKRENEFFLIVGDILGKIHFIKFIF